MVGEMGQLGTDTRRAQAAALAADLAIYAERMPRQSARGQGTIRELTRSTERALRSQISEISDPALKRAAIESRARLSAALTQQRDRDRGRERDGLER